jgi:hypothetical protein
MNAVSFVICYITLLLLSSAHGQWVSVCKSINIKTMKVKGTLIETLVQLLFSFDQIMKVKEILM